MLNIFRSTSRLLSSSFRTSQLPLRTKSNLFEPDYLAVSLNLVQYESSSHLVVGKLIKFVYLQELTPKYPVYPCVNLQVKGYDFAILESYQRFLHRTADSLDLDILDW